MEGRSVATFQDEQSYLHKIIEEQLGYQFDENDLSPDVRLKIASYKPRASKIKDIYLAKDGVSKSTTVSLAIFLFLGVFSLIGGGALIFYGILVAPFTNVFGFMVLGCIGLFIGSILSAIFLPRSRDTRGIRIREEYSRLYSDLSALTKEIHNELVETHKRKTGPQEVIHYEIVTEFSFKDGALAVRCPTCKGNIDIIKDKLEGNKYKCAYCGNMILIPERILGLL